LAVFTYTATAIGGGPENGAFCYVYTRGTTTPATTYSDVGRTIPRTNPIVADADGRVPPAYFADGARRPEVYMQLPVRKWRDDLGYLHDRYYRDHFRFGWPDVV